MQHCPGCGQKLTRRHIGDEGLVPYCPGCEKPVFDHPDVAVIVLVHDGGDVLLAKQGPDPARRLWGLVAGYVQRGETAEEAARREVLEETGLEVTQLRYLRSYYLTWNGALMLAYEAAPGSREVKRRSAEIDEARWFPVAEAVRMTPAGSLARAIVEGHAEGI